MGKNVVDKVNKLLQDGVKKTVTVETAVRKDSRAGKDGVVIATFKSEDDRKVILDHKKVLNDNAQFKSVRIFPDRPYEERVMHANMKALLGAFGKEDLVLRGNRIVKQQRQFPG